MRFARTTVRFIAAAGISAVLSSCGDGGSSVPAPRYVVATHGTANFNQGDFCPASLGFSVLLEEGGTGWVAMEHWAIGTNLAKVIWQKDNGRIHVTSPEVRVVAYYSENPDPYYNFRAEVGWRDLFFSANDEDRDGTAEIGEASITITCDEFWLYGDLYRKDAEFGLTPNPAPVSVSIHDSHGWEPLYTWEDAFQVLSSSPILAESIAGAKLLANGVPIPATVSPIHSDGPLAEGFLLDPTQPVPFDADITIDAAGVTDTSGNPVVVAGQAVHTVEDPGPITDNPSFETTGGWIDAGIFSRTDVWSGFSVPDGERYGSKSTGANLVGYFDVPADASSLQFEEATYNDTGGCNNGPRMSIRAAVSLPKTVEPVEPIACDDDCLGYIIPWHTVTVDLTAARGQRVVLNVRPAFFTECVPDEFPELLLDHFRINQ